jgi:hypothetical protein
MRLTAVVLPLLFLIDTGPRGPIKPSDPGLAHSDQIEAYASIIAGATRAEKACTGYRTNMAALAEVRAKLAIRAADRPELSRLVQAVERKVSVQIEEFGVASWCASILGLFGPDGTIVPGLLELRQARTGVRLRKGGK